MKVTTISRSRFSKLSFLLVILAIMALWFMVAFGFWWKLVYTNPEKVFWDTIGNNFSTSGYSRLTSMKTEEMSQLSASQLQFGQFNVAETHLTGSSGEGKYKAEVISTPTEEYIRYVENSTLDKDSKALGVWAKNDSQGESNQSFGQLALFLTLFPMGNVPSQDRATLIAFAKENTVYSPDVKNVIEETVNGRKVLTYKVSVQLQSYAAMVQQFATSIGLADAAGGISPADYAGTPPVPLEVSIDPISRRIVRVMNPGDDTTVEAYRGYGISSQVVDIPKNALSTVQLQELLQQN